METKSSAHELMSRVEPCITPAAQAVPPPRGDARCTAFTFDIFNTNADYGNTMRMEIRLNVAGTNFGVMAVDCEPRERDADDLALMLVMLSGKAAWGYARAVLCMPDYAAHLILEFRDDGTAEDTAGERFVCVTEYCSGLGRDASGSMRFCVPLHLADVPSLSACVSALLSGAQGESPSHLRFRRSEREVKKKQNAEDDSSMHCNELSYCTVDDGPPERPTETQRETRSGSENAGWTVVARKRFKHADAQPVPQRNQANTRTQRRKRRRNGGKAAAT